MPSKKVTMEDVAREAGVSKATVSYCISHTRPIREETRRRVRAAIEKLGYQAICDRRNVQKKFIAFQKFVTGLKNRATIEYYDESLKPEILKKQIQDKFKDRIEI